MPLSFAIAFALIILTRLSIILDNKPLIKIRAIDLLSSASPKHVILIFFIGDIVNCDDIIPILSANL